MIIQKNKYNIYSRFSFGHFMEAIRTLNSSCWLSDIYTILLRNKRFIRFPKYFYVKPPILSSVCMQKY